jgi:hypothetical protein
MTRLVFVATLLCLTATAARAQRETHESERSTYIDFRIGLYRPDIDSEFKKSPTEDRPYKRIFKDERSPMWGLTLERHFFDAFGTLSGGLGGGFWHVKGNGVPTTSGPSAATDKTELVILPFQGELSYRLDYFENVFPLVPVARGGLDYDVWWVNNGAGETAKFANGHDAEGATWGWHYAVGVHLLLDYLAQDMAADFDRDAGVNGSYLTFEYQVSQVDDFGSSHSFRLGDKTLIFGLSLDL